MAQWVQQYQLARAAAAGDKEKQATLFGAIKDMVYRAISLATAPIRLVLSRPARRLYVTTFFFLVASVVLLAISSAAYSIFYYNYIPQISLEKIVYLQFGDDAYPYGITELSPQILITNQAYDVSVTLTLPRTTSNLAAGNFMVDLQLLNSAPSGILPPPVPPLSSALNQKDQNVVSYARRPAILPQPTHVLLSAIDTLLLRLPWSIIVYPFQRSRSTSILTLESDSLEIPMIEDISFSSGIRGRGVPDVARLELHTLKHVRGLQVYRTKLQFHAKFRGLKYIVYKYRVTSFLLFSTIFYLVSISAMSLAWFLISIVFWMRDQETKNKAKLGGRSNGSAVKVEPEEENQSKLPLKTESSSAGTLSHIQHKPSDQSMTKHEPRFEEEGDLYSSPKYVAAQGNTQVHGSSAGRHRDSDTLDFPIITSPRRDEDTFEHRVSPFSFTMRQSYPANLVESFSNSSSGATPPDREDRSDADGIPEFVAEQDQMVSTSETEKGDDDLNFDSGIGTSIAGGAMTGGGESSAREWSSGAAGGSRRLERRRSGRRADDFES